MRVVGVFVGRDIRRHSKRTPLRWQDGLRLNQQQRVFPPRKGGREQRDRSALVPPEDRSFHLPCHHDELLAQQGVLSHQLRARSQQVSREPPDDRTWPWTQGFTDRLRGLIENHPQLANSATSEDATDLPRDEPEFQAHVMREIFNDPAPEERGSHDTCAWDRVERPDLGCEEATGHGIGRMLSPDLGVYALESLDSNPEGDRLF
jgi:hypothetical protein